MNYKNIFPERGEIWLCNFNYKNYKKIRPVLILSNDISNKKISKITVVPFTCNIKELMLTVMVEADEENKLKVPSMIRVTDIITLNKSRIKNKIGVLLPEKLEEVEAKLKLHLDL